MAALPWKAVYNADPSAPSKWPSLNGEVESALDAAHAFLDIKRTLFLHFSELAWWCHLLLTGASLSNLYPSALCCSVELLTEHRQAYRVESTEVATCVQMVKHYLLIDVTFHSNESQQGIVWDVSAWEILTNLSKSWPTMPASTWAVRFFSSIHSMRFYRWKANNRMIGKAISITCQS